MYLQVLHATATKDAELWLIDGPRETCLSLQESAEKLIGPIATTKLAMRAIGRQIDSVKYVRRYDTEEN